MDTCYQCNKPENGWGYPMRILHDCDHCGLSVCSECVAEVDYGGGDDGRGLTQWTCGPCLNPEAYVTEFPERHPQLKSLSEVQSERDAQ